MDTVFDLNGTTLSSAAELERDDPDFVLNAIKNFGFSLAFASDRLK